MQTTRIVGSAALMLVAFAGGWAAAREPYPKITPLLAANTTVIGSPSHIPMALHGSRPHGGSKARRGNGLAHARAAAVRLHAGRWVDVDYGPYGTRTYKIGDNFMEAISAAHNGRNTGAGRMRVLAVYIGADGKANAIPASAPR